MDELLKLLVSNIYIVIIVIGFLLSVLNKARGKQKPGGSGMPTFGGGQNGRPQARPLEEKPAQPERPQRQPSSTQQSRPAGAQRTQPSAPGTAGPMGGTVFTSQLKPREAGAEAAFADAGQRQSLLARSLDAEKLASARPNAAAIADKPLPGEQPQSGTIRVPQGNELRQAFIMAEVFGPPRSKRPLRQK